MKPLKPGLLIASVVIAGCATKAPVEPDTDTAKPPRVSTDPNVVTEEEFKKIPKNLRPEELEKRDDTKVVIRSGNKGTIKEYRIGPFLYAIHVTPKKGKPYFLVAADQKGNFIRADKPNMLVPSWTIFDWK